MLGQGRGNIIKRGFDKMKEWIVAVKLERNFTKEEIITLYLNRAPWGNVYGIRNASRTYFQKEPKNLKVEEAAVLIGMLKGFIYNPISYPKASVDRRNTVINQMTVCHRKMFFSREARVTSVKRCAPPARANAATMRRIYIATPVDSARAALDTSREMFIAGY